MNKELMDMAQIMHRLINIPTKRRDFAS